MTSTARHELIIIVVGSTLFILLTLYSIGYARAAVRDDLRMQDITNLKRALEQYYNEHEFYVSPSNSKIGCTVLDDTSPLLQEQFIDAIPHDVREAKGFIYSYCVTSAPKNRTTGFYLEASLESNKPKGVFFDEDELRKFDYRVLAENDRLLYRVCGGEEKQCNELPA